MTLCTVTTESIPQNEPLKTSWQAMGLSIGIHLVLVLLLIFLVSRLPKSAPGEPDRFGEIVLAVKNADQKVEFLTDSDVTESSSVPSAAPEISDQPPPQIDLETELDQSLAGMVPVNIGPGAANMTNETIRSSDSKPYELTDADLKMIEADQKMFQSRQPAGPQTTISVFGSGGLSGRRFVFLIDRSKSMGDQGLGVLKQARKELTQAIAGLQPHHKFQIVVYHNSTATIAKRQLLDATEENKQLVPEFLANLVAFGGTNHENGLYAALAFRPDVLVMMTDGGSPDLHQGHLTALARAAGRTQVHAIQFGSGPQSFNQHFLMQLAAMNSGSYRYVDVRKWLK